jgi:hypothetical protein
VSSEPEAKWQTVISALLRFRKVERAKVRKGIVDALEQKFVRKIPNEKLVAEDEDGVLLSEAECDPHQFVFPFKLGSMPGKKSALDDIDDDCERRDIEVEELGEEKPRGFEDEEEEEL